jgi:hypothetical protein
MLCRCKRPIEISYSTTSIIKVGWCWLGTWECAPLKVSGSILCGANFGELGRCKIGACLVFLSSCHYFYFSPVFRICHLKKVINYFFLFSSRVCLWIIWEDCLFIYYCWMWIIYVWLCVEKLWFCVNWLYKMDYD